MDTIYESLERVGTALRNFESYGVDVYEIEGVRFGLRRYGERYVRLCMRDGTSTKRDVYGVCYTGFTEELIEWSRQRLEGLEREMRMMRALGYRVVSPLEYVREYDGGSIRALRSLPHIELERTGGEDRRYYMSSRRVWRCLVEFEKRGSTIESTSSMTPLLRECVVSSRYLRELEKR